MKKLLLVIPITILFMLPIIIKPVDKVSAKPIDCSGWLIQTNGYGVDQTSAEEDGCNQCVNACATLNGWSEQCETVSCQIKGGLWRCSVRMCCHFQ